MATFKEMTPQIAVHIPGVDTSMVNAVMEYIDTHQKRIPRDAIVLTEDDVEAFKDAWTRADRRGEAGGRVRAGLEAVGFTVEPELDSDTVEALTVAVWGVAIPNEAGRAGRVIAEQLAKSGKRIVNIEDTDTEAGKS